MSPFLTQSTHMMNCRAVQLFSFNPRVYQTKQRFYHYSSKNHLLKSNRKVHSSIIGSVRDLINYFPNQYTNGITICAIRFKIIGTHVTGTHVHVRSLTKNCHVSTLSFIDLTRFQQLYNINITVQLVEDMMQRRSWCS